MNCDRVRDNIKAYIDGELGPIQRLRVGRHLARCAECREEMEAMSELTEKLQSTPGVPAPEGLREKVMGKIEFTPQRKAAFWNRPIDGPILSALVLIVVVVLAGQVLFPTFSRSREAARRAPEVRPQAWGEQVAKSPPPVAPKLASPQRRALHDAKGGLVLSDVPAPAPLMIIKTAQISVRVKQFQPAYNSAVFIAKSAGGYVTDSSSETEGDAPTSGNLTVRVPVNAFERTLDRLGRLGKVLSKGINGEDVTGEAVDLQSRLRNKRAEERQYLDIMNRARKVQDIVTVSNELYRVRGEIEEAEGRLKYLKSSSAMATIQVTLSEKDKPKPPVKKSSLMNTFNGAVGSLVGTLRGLAGMLIWLGVYSPFWGIPLVVWIYTRKKATAASCS